MEGNITFYTHGNTLELNGKIFSAGELTEDILNLGGEEYWPMHECFERIQELAGVCAQNQDRAVWWELNNEMESLAISLRQYKVFQLILADDDALFNETRTFTERFTLFPDEDFNMEDYDLGRLTALGEDYYWGDGEDGESTGGPTRQLPDILLIYIGSVKTKWRYYKKSIDRYQRYLHDIHAFNATIRNFIHFMLAKLETNSPEHYAAALYDFYNDERLVEKLIVNPITYGAPNIYTKYDSYVLSYVPREVPGGGFAICQEHVTDSLQALLKADYMLALNSGHNIRKCVICGRYFMLKTGAHALYCEGACPHAPRYTCRQFGSLEVQKELAKDIPKVRAKVAAFERITKDMQRGIISREDARAAKDCVRDRLYDALRTQNVTVEEFEKSIAPETLYAACGITRKSKPRGRPKRDRGDEVP